MSRKVLLVDDQPEFLALARDLLSEDPDIIVVGQAQSGEEALALLSDPSQRPEAVILDVQMPGMDGFTTARLLQTRHPGLLILLISALDEPQYGGLARASGAAAFLSKRNFSAAAVAALLA